MTTEDCAFETLIPYCTGEELYIYKPGSDYGAVYGEVYYSTEYNKFGWFKGIDPTDCLGFLEVIEDGDCSDKYLGVEISRSDLKPAKAARAICLNTPVFESHSFEGVYDPDQHDVMVAFALMADRKWGVSFYSTKPEVDCGAIAKSYGGVGHKGAAGCILEKLPWEIV